MTDPLPHAPPKGRATSYDVARAAGVAQSTVSRCFQDNSGISPPTRLRVQEAARKLGYLPNALARSLITRQSNLIGVVVTRYTLRGNPDVLYAIGASLAAAGKQLLLVTIEAGDFATLQSLRGILEYPLEALISCVLIPEDDLRHIQSRVPIVFYNREVAHLPADSLPVDSVTADHARAAAQLADLLYQAGHRRLLVIGGPAEAPVSRLRTSGFTTRAKHLGAQIVATLETNYGYPDAHEKSLAWLQKNPRPDAVFCANDQIAMAVMDACRTDLAWTIPNDISVVGFDDIAESARPVYQLTTMHQDSVAMAHEAVRLLLLRLANPEAPPVSTVIGAVFVPRQSARLARPEG